MSSAEPPVFTHEELEAMWHMLPMPKDPRGFRDLCSAIAKLDAYEQAHRDARARERAQEPR